MKKFPQTILPTLWFSFLFISLVSPIPSYCTSATSATKAQSDSLAVIITFENPMRTTKVISILLAEETDISVEMYNVLGGLLSKLMEGIHLKGTYRIYLDRCDLPIGVYFIVAKTPSTKVVKKLVVIR